MKAARAPSPRVAAAARGLYSAAWWLATPLLVAYLSWRARAQPQYLRHWPQRWGWHPARRDDGPLIWVHAVSVGETRAAQPLVTALLDADPSLRVLLTHMTPTGRDTGAQLFGPRYGERVVQAYLPYDGPFAPGRFLRAWRPRAGLIMETELWPNLCAAAARAGVPLALVNARLSERSLRRGLRWRALTAPALASLARVVAQTPEDARRIAQLGRADAMLAGNLKFDVEPPADLVERGRAWRTRLEGRPVVLAASTREGEEALLMDAWRATAPQPAGSGRAPLMVIVPRHPQRFEEVAALAAARGMRLARRADLDSPAGPGAADLVLGDSMGEMFAYHAMADVAIIGGSLLPFGAQNLIEACAVGVPVILGPSTFNFAQAAEQAIEAGAAIRVDDARAAVDQARALLADEATRAAMAARALAFALAHRGATRRTLDALAGMVAPDR